MTIQNDRHEITNVIIIFVINWNRDCYIISPNYMFSVPKRNTIKQPLPRFYFCDADNAVKRVGLLSHTYSDSDTIHLLDTLSCKIQNGLSLIYLIGPTSNGNYIAVHPGKHETYITLDQRWFTVGPMSWTEGQQ